MKNLEAINKDQFFKIVNSANQENIRSIVLIGKNGSGKSFLIEEYHDIYKSSSMYLPYYFGYDNPVTNDYKNNIYLVSVGQYIHGLKNEQPLYTNVTSSFINTGYVFINETNQEKIYGKTYLNRLNEILKIPEIDFLVNDLNEKIPFQKFSSGQKRKYALTIAVLVADDGSIILID